MTWPAAVVTTMRKWIVAPGREAPDLRAHGLRARDCRQRLRGGAGPVHRRRADLEGDLSGSALGVDAREQRRRRVRDGGGARCRVGDGGERRRRSSWNSRRSGIGRGGGRDARRRRSRMGAGARGERSAREQRDDDGGDYLCGAGHGGSSEKRGWERYPPFHTQEGDFSLSRRIPRNQQDSALGTGLRATRRRRHATVALVTHCHKDSRVSTSQQAGSHVSTGRKGS